MEKSTTNREKDMIQTIKARIEKELKFGDKAEACRKAGISVTTLDRGLAKESYDDVTDFEHEGIKELMKILNSRKNKQSEIESYVN